MKRYIKASTSVNSFLSESLKTDYAKDLAKYHPGKYDQEGIGWLARQYGFNLVEMLDVLQTAEDLNYAECLNPGVSYKIFPYEE